MKTPREWKDFYRIERESLGEEGLARLLDEAPAIALPLEGALVFPHTRLAASGRLVASVAKAIAESPAPSVLAIGVLHGRDRRNTSLRGIHGSAVETEEFSLDNFSVLVELAARRVGKAAPRIEKRYPFLTGDQPRSLPGFDDLRDRVKRGAVLVATTDPIHHGAGYGTPADQQLPRESDAARDWAQETIEDAFAMLRRRDYGAFRAQAETVKSDFRDVGPVIAELTPLSAARVVELQLVDYADVLDAPQPTWVAAALVIT